MLDNPDKLVEMVVESGSFSTDMKPEDVIDLTSKCRNAAGLGGRRPDLKEAGHGARPLGI